MKLLELFNTDRGSDVIRNHPALWMTADKEIGGRKISFYAESPKEDGVWEVDFFETKADEQGYLKKDWSLTKGGDEIKVFSFVIDMLRKLVTKEKPKVIKFSADKEDEGRADLYKRMVDRWAKQYGYESVARNKSYRGMEQVNFKLTLIEGQMKRSDPWISGEKDGPRTEPVKKYPAPKPKVYDTKIKNLASRANISPDKVEIAWDEAKAEVDSKLTNYWAIVMNRTKKKIGLD